jgi:hypothetical protein
MKLSVPVRPLGFDNVFKEAVVYFVIGLLIFSSLLVRAEELSIDYHAHILSPEMGKEMAPLCDEMGCDAVRITEGVDAETLLQALENSSFNRAIIMSGGYFGGMPELERDIETQKKLTRHENAYSAEQAAKSKKIFSFFSVNPLSDYALEETRYWMIEGGHSGLKLNLVNSDANLFNSIGASLHRNSRSRPLGTIRSWRCVFIAYSTNNSRSRSTWQVTIRSPILLPTPGLT